MLYTGLVVRLFWKQLTSITAVEGGRRQLRPTVSKTDSSIQVKHARSTFYVQPDIRFCISKCAGHC